MSLSYNPYWDSEMDDFTPDIVTVVPRANPPENEHGEPQYDVPNTRRHHCLLTKSIENTIGNNEEMQRPADELRINPVPIGGTVPVYIQFQDKLILSDGRSPVVRTVDQFNLYESMYLQTVSFQ